MALGAPKARILLSCLLLQANQVVTSEALVDQLWGDVPPRGARNTLQTYVMRLRQALGPAGKLILTRPSGYVLETPDQTIDLQKCRQHFDLARQTAIRDDLSAEAAELHAGLALWRGRPLQDVPSASLQRDDVPALMEEWFQATERRIDIDLRLRKHAEVVAELRSLTSTHPLRERLWARLMQALHGAGRQSEALQAYLDVSAILRNELGIDPCDELQSLQRHILRRDTEPPDTRATEQARVPHRAPFQLPADVADFVGRETIIHRIRGLCFATNPDETRRWMPLAVLAGQPGVGKTALAIHIGHEFASEFPDGVLYLNMRGYSASPPMSATEALARILRALGAAPEDIPAEVDEQASVFRSLVAHRRVMIILDDAASPDQVRPLLPGTASCAVIVTSRDTLHGLAVVNGAHLLAINAISTSDGVRLLSSQLNSRVLAEPAAAEELVKRCGHLPLAIRIAAATLAAAPQLSIADYSAQLVAGNRLSMLAIDGDEEAAVEMAFDLSYSRLKPDLARVFRYLSLVPGPDFDVCAVANLAHTDPNSAKRLLERLVNASLLQSAAPGRFQFHDLIREYANKRCSIEETIRAREEAFGRLLWFYTYTADKAGRALYPDMPRLRLALQGTPPTLPRWASKREAFEWLQAETPNIEAMILNVLATGSNRPVWLLADAMLGLFDRQRLDNVWRSTFTAALAVATRQNSLDGSAAMNRGLGKLHFLRSQFHAAEERYAIATDAFRECGDHVNEARSRNSLASLAVQFERYDEAMDQYHRALGALGDGPGRADVLANLGTTLVLLGRHQEAATLLDDAAELAQQLGLTHLRPRVASALALNELWCGQLSQASRHLRAAYETWSQLKYRHGLAQTLRNMAEVHLEAEQIDKAESLAAQALTVAEEIGAPWMIAGASVTLGLSSLAAGHTDAAAAHFVSAQGKSTPDLRYWQQFANLGIVACQRILGATQTTISLAEAAAADRRPRVRTGAHLELAKIHRARSRWRAAFRHVHHAEQIAHQCGYRLDEARAIQERGRIFEARSEPAHAEICREEPGHFSRIFIHA